MKALTGMMVAALLISLWPPVWTLWEVERVMGIEPTTFSLGS